MSFKAALSAVVLCGCVSMGCEDVSASALAEAAIDEVLPGGDEGESVESQAIATDLCAAAMANVEKRGASSECDDAIIADCADVVGMLSAPYLKALSGCLAGGEIPAVCLVAVTMDLKPTAAHHDLAKAYCDECLFGLSGCEDVFYFGEDDQLGLGSIALPFSDELVRQIADECTQDLTCSVDLPGCAQDVLVNHLVPEKTVLCLIDPFKGG